MAPRIVEEHRRELNIAVLITAIIILGSYSGILPLSTYSSDDVVYFPSWARLDCVQYSSTDIEKTTLAWYQTYGAWPSKGEVFLKDSYQCKYIGGCVVKFESAGVGGNFVTGITEWDNPQSISYGTVVTKATSLHSFQALTGVPAISGRVVVYADNPHKLQITSADPSIQSGYTDDVAQTFNCELSQASATLRQAISNNNPSGQIISGNKANITYTDRQLPEGQSLNYVVGWNEYPSFANIRTFNGQKVRCVPHEGIYQLKGATTPSGTYYYQGLKIQGYTEGTTCCGFSENECGQGYGCDIATLLCTPDATGCVEPFASEEVCDWQAKQYYVSDCANGNIVKTGLIAPKCCPNSGTCKATEVCNPKLGCLAKNTQQVLSGSQCSIDGETIRGIEVLRPADSPYEERECPVGQTCCYGSSTSQIGSCTSDCHASTGGGAGSDEPPLQCKYEGFLGAWAKMIGMGCDGMGMFLAIIALIIVIAIILAIIGIVIKIAG